MKIKRWTPDNPTNEYPRLNSTRSYLFSDYFVHDGSFVRLQNINIGYTIPVRKAFIRSVRVFANIENAYTFTKFDGYDPEVGVDGIYWGGYPRLQRATCRRSRTDSIPTTIFTRARPMPSRVFSMPTMP